MIALGQSPPGLHPISEIVVVPLRPGGHREFWRAKGDFAFGFNTVWVNNTDLAFVWQDHFKGTQIDYTARTAVRLLNTKSGSRNLLSSSVLVRGGGDLGLIQSAYAPPGGGPIIASLARYTPATGARGTVLVRLVALSPATGKITRVFASRTLKFRDADARVNEGLDFGVIGVDASGMDALVNGPHFGMIRNGTFTPLPAGPALQTGAAW